MTKYDTLLVLSSDAFFLMTPEQSDQTTAAKLFGWGSSLLPCSLGEDSAGLWCRSHQYQDMIIELFVPLPKVLKTMTPHRSQHGAS